MTPAGTDAGTDNPWTDSLGTDVSGRRIRPVPPLEARPGVNGTDGTDVGRIDQGYPSRRKCPINRGLDAIGTDRTDKLLNMGWSENRGIQAAGTARRARPAHISILSVPSVPGPIFGPQPPPGDPPVIPLPPYAQGHPPILPRRGRPPLVDAEQVRQLYLARQPLAAVAETVGCTPAAARASLVRCGLRPPQHVCRWTMYQRAALILLVESGEGTPDIAWWMGLTARCAAHEWAAQLRRRAIAGDDLMRAMIRSHLTGEPMSPYHAQELAAAEPTAPPDTPPWPRPLSAPFLVLPPPAGHREPGPWVVPPLVIR